ncbi:MAG: sulfotransferase [Candidatus Electrothrix sp. GW3-4]|uniref:sulfotransferase family protein n=1 Tax=Candidatus Electrothrix sp. GW3-4 TaxID=3126740 RepID=UPI0030CB453E
MKPLVVILLSDKRSGSTIFEKELCKHPKVNHVTYSSHTYFETHHWLKAACILNTPKQLFYGHKIYKGYGSRTGARQYLIDTIRGNVPDFAIPDNDESLVFEGWEALCRTLANPVFFEKSPQYPAQWAALDLILKWMQRTEFDVRLIGLVRNPMSVMYSAHKLFSTNPDERQFGWAQSYRNILAMRDIVGCERFHMLRYEDLITQPKQTFQKVCEYLGVEPCKEIGENVHAQSVALWRDDPTFTLQLHESVMRFAEHFGYGEEEMYNPPKPGPATYERIIGTTQKTMKLMTARLYSRLVKPIFLTIQNK